MGCDTKGYVVTENFDVREIGKRVLAVIRTIQGNRREGSAIFVKNSNVFVKPEYDPEWNFFILRLRDGDDDRQMFVHMGTEDFEECHNLGKNGIIFSFGMWGNSVELIKKFLDAFQDMGDCYVQENDCGDAPVVYKN